MFVPKHPTLLKHLDYVRIWRRPIIEACQLVKYWASLVFIEDIVHEKKFFPETGIYTISPIILSLIW